MVTEMQRMYLESKSLKNIQNLLVKRQLLHWLLMFAQISPHMQKPASWRCCETDCIKNLSCWIMKNIPVVILYFNDHALRKKT